ncbi:MAG: GAF domain-containing protein [Candidatus Aminicenantia bacterium]
MNKDKELLKNWQKFNVLSRFIVASMVFLSLFLLKNVNFKPVIFSVIFVFTYNLIIYSAILKNKLRNWMNYLILFLDIFVISLGVFFTGGIKSPLHYLYFVSFAYASVSLKSRHTFSILGIVIVLYSTACFNDLLHPASWTEFGIRIFFFSLFTLPSFVTAKLEEKRIRERDKAIESGEALLSQLKKTWTERERAIEKEQKIWSRLKLLCEVVSEIMPLEDSENIFKNITNAIQKTLGFPYASVMIYDEERNVLEFKAGSGEWEEKTPPNFTQKITEGLIGKAFRERRTLLVNDVTKDPDYIAPYIDLTKSEMVIPIKTDTEVIGLLDIQSGRLNEFEEEDVIILETLADILAIIIVNFNLYRELKDAYDELLKAQEKIVLMEKLQLIDEISQEVAHNFHNIFSIIEGRLELLELKNPPLELKRDIEEIKKAVNSGIKMVENFYKSIEESREVFKILEPSEILEEAINSCIAYLRGKKLNYYVKIEKFYNHDNLIIGHRELLKQAFFNVILNGFEAMRNGGTLKIETNNFEKFVEIKIKDSGEGMGEDTKKRVLQPFFSTKKQKKEFFGLYNTYRIISFHQGELEIVSDKGKGTTVIIRLPSSIPS